MYYHEKVIDGVLCFTHSPKGEYRPVSAKELTRRLMVAKAEVEQLKADLEMVGSSF